MRRTARFAIWLLVVVAIIGASVTTASAFPGVSFATRCSTCHSGAGANPTATLVSNDGTTATYNVTGSGLEWAVFDGTTRVAGQSGTSGQFSVAVGGTYTLFDVFGFPGPLGQTTVSPTAPVAQFTIMASAGPNGTISPGSVTVDSGSNVTYTITADPGFHIADVLVDGVSVGAVGTHTFTNVTAGHTISASFAMDVLTTFTLTPSAGAHGSIAPAVAQTLVAGSDFTFMMSPDAGYHVEDVLVDGVSVGAVGSYTFTNVQADHTISVSFVIDDVGMFTITPAAGSNGSISPADVQTVAAGSQVTFSITPDPGYHIESLSVDGVVIPTVSSYTFTNVQADHTIMATFSNDPDVAAPTVITLHSNHSRVRHGHSVHLSSVLHNSVPALFFGAQVRYEVRRPGSERWVLLGKVLADQAGATSFDTTLSRRGTYRFRVRYLGSDDFKASTSRTVKVLSR